MKIRIEIDEEKLQELVMDFLKKMIGEHSFEPEHMTIETKSKQNYKSEWESGAGYRVVYEVND